ncbi:MAG: type II secretion system minor pseudopilin GspI [Gammaproteobacteria bacterium]|nr:type II secretion system minor pseudopilin GspI [Gammaproteobacteria bacterium]
MMSFSVKQSGITLLELLVALAVFSASAIAILDTIVATSRVVEDLEHKTLGHWVAGNKLSEVTLKSKWPNIGVTRDQIDMADRQWFLVTKVEATARPDMRKITVEVRLNKDHEASIVDRLAFVGKLK